MISFAATTHRFDFRAAAVILHEENVLLHRAEGLDFWALPSSRVAPGEDAAAIAVREMQAQLGVRISIDRLLWVVENFFVDNTQPHQELGLYFAATAAPDSAVLNTAKSHIGAAAYRPLSFAWFPRKELASIDVHPLFLREALAPERLEFAHLIQREASYETIYERCQ